MKEIIVNLNEKDWISKIPYRSSGLYYFYIDDEIVYIGKAVGIRQRITTHFNENCALTHRQIDYSKITKIRITFGNCEYEREEILKHRPRWNIKDNPFYKVEKNQVCSYCGKRHSIDFECDFQKFIWDGMINNLCN